MKFIHIRTVALSAAMACVGTIAFPESICGQPESQSSSSQQIQDPSGPQSRQQMKAKSFLMKTAAENKLEIALGQLAQIKAENPQVRQFGKQLATAHEQANQKLDTLAQQQGVPMGLQEFTQLTQASGQQFDQAYLRFLIQTGRQGLQQLQQIADNHPDQGIKQFAREQVQEMQKHLQQAQRVQTQIQAGGQIQEPAGAQPSLHGPSSPSAQSSQQQFYYSQLEQRAEGRHFPTGEQGAIIREQAGAESEQQLQQQVKQLQQQLQQLQLQVQQLQRNQGQGQQGQPASGGQSGQMEMPEAREFVMTGVAYSKLCSALSQLAVERAQSSEVRKLAQGQQQAGQQVTQRLQQLAQQHDVQMDVQQVQQLTKASGREFDQAYVSFIVDEHQRALQDLEQAASAEQTDPQIQQFARAQLPEMEKHLEHAQRLQSQLQASGSIDEPAGSAPREFRDLRELIKP